MYKCKHHKIQELVPKDIYNRFGESSWQFLNPQMLITLDQLWEKFGTMYLNNWLWGGSQQQQVFRTSKSNSYSPTSQHALGCASDASFKYYTAQQVRDYVFSNPEEFHYITCIEMNVNWFHFDVRNCNRIKKVYPKK